MPSRLLQALLRAVGTAPYLTHSLNSSLEGIAFIRSLHALNTRAGIRGRGAAVPFTAQTEDVTVSDFTLSQVRAEPNAYVKHGNTKYMRVSAPPSLRPASPPGVQSVINRVGAVSRNTAPHVTASPTRQPKAGETQGQGLTKRGPPIQRGIIRP